MGGDNVGPEEATRVAWLKAIFMITAFLEAAILGSVPILSSKFQESPCVLGVANAFSGGVFLAIALMHIMPEQTETWECMQFNNSACLGGTANPFPLPFFLLCSGYTVILIIDKVLFDTHAILGEHDHEDGEGANDNKASILRKSVASILEKGSVGPNGEYSAVAVENALKKSLAGSLRKSEVFAARMSMARGNQPAESTDDMPRNQSTGGYKEIPDHAEVPANAGKPAGAAEDEIVFEKNADAASSNTGLQQLTGPGSAADQKGKKPGALLDVDRKPTCVENMTPFVLLVGLGTHALFEGLAVGIAAGFQEVLFYSIAIWLHKGAAGMSLGISMARTFPNEKRFSVGMICLFGIFTPAGVGLGWILKDADSDMYELVFACLAAGSFLYIACSEVIVEEFSISSYRFVKLAFFLLGICMIAGLVFLPGDDEPDCHVCP